MYRCGFCLVATPRLVCRLSSPPKLSIRLMSTNAGRAHKSVKDHATLSKSPKIKETHERSKENETIQDLKQKQISPKPKGKTATNEREQEAKTELNRQPTTMKSKIIPIETPINELHQQETTEQINSNIETQIHTEKQTKQKISITETPEDVEVTTMTTTTTTTTVIPQQQNTSKQKSIVEKQNISEPQDKTQASSNSKLTAPQALHLARQALETKPADYKRAIQFYAKALKIFHTDRDVQMICEVLLAIAKAHTCDRDYVHSFSTLKELGHFSRIVNRPDMESLSLTMMASILAKFEKGEEQAKSFLQLSLKLANQPPTKYPNCTQASMNISRKAVLEALGSYEKIVSNDPEEAEKHFKEGLRLSEEEGDLKSKLQFQAEILLEDDEEDVTIETTDNDPDIETTKD